MSIIYILLLGFSGTLVECSHFRGATFSWSYDGNQVLIRFRITWRLNWGGVYCDQSIINAGTLIGVDAMTCISGCTDTIGNLLYQCTDFSPVNENNWSSGIGSLTYTPPAGTTTFSFGYQSCCWIGSLYQGGGTQWSLVATVDLSVRADTGQVNHSPVADMLPLVFIQYGCDFVINIPVSDVDGDIVRCRWANGAGECGGVCNVAPIFTLDENACTLTYDAAAAASYTASFYAVAIQVEDFASATSTTPLSSVPLQFLTQVYQVPAPCASWPEFISPTPEDQDCLLLEFGETMNITLIARSNNALTTITTTSAAGMQRSPPVFTSDATWNYISVNVIWTPIANDIGNKRVLCFTATDSLGITGPVACFTILVTDCLLPQSPENGNFEANITATCDYIGRYTCDPEYDVIGTADVVCSASGNWSSPPVVCLYQGCEPLAAPGNGSIYQPLRSYGSYTLFMCDPGFHAVGDISPLCLPTRNWSSDPPTCELTDCGDLSAPNNGSVMYNTTLVGDIAWFSCDEGFDLNGDENVTCQDNGWWSSTIHPCFTHTCVLKDCGPPEAPGNGSVEYDSTTYESIALFHCEQRFGFKLIGQTTTQCLSNGTWSGTVPACERPVLGEFSGSLDESSSSLRFNDSSTASNSSLPIN